MVTSFPNSARYDLLTCTKQLSGRGRDKCKTTRAKLNSFGMSFLVILVLLYHIQLAAKAVVLFKMIVSTLHIPDSLPEQICTVYWTMKELLLKNPGREVIMQLILASSYMQHYEVELKLNFLIFVYLTLQWRWQHVCIICQGPKRKRNLYLHHFRYLKAVWTRATYSHGCKILRQCSRHGTSSVALLGMQVSIPGAEKFKLLCEYKNLHRF